MLITHRQTSKKLSEKGKEKQPHLPDLFEPQYLTSLHILKKKRKSGMRLGFLKRISPFLLLEFFLAVLFPYMMITGRGSIRNEWLLLFLFIFIEVNVLFTDFALWNFFKGKKILRIWLIEVPLTFLVIHFLL
jgi:hypothetical protein